MQISLDPVVVQGIPQRLCCRMRPGSSLVPADTGAPGARLRPGHDRTVRQATNHPDGPRALPLAERLVLGLPSLALGVVPTLAPRAVAELVGLAGVVPTTVVRAVGVRETVVALAFLHGRSPRWLWVFVGQDTVDLPVLAWLLVTGRATSGRRLRRALAAYVVMAGVDVTTTLVQDVLPRRGQRREAAFVPSEPSSAL
jgi:hypothetical protein